MSSSKQTKTRAATSRTTSLKRGADTRSRSMSRGNTDMWSIRRKPAAESRCRRRGNWRTKEST